MKETELILNRKIYPLEVIYAAAYVFLDKIYIILNENENKDIIVTIRCKNNNQDISKLANEFYNELINYSNYYRRSDETKKIREIFLQKALITNKTPPKKISEDEELNKILNKLASDENDNDEIIVPWDNNES
jgi:His-Xaa-Ser system protein HxsD